MVSAVSGLQVPASLLDDSGLPKVTNGESRALQLYAKHYLFMVNC